MIMLMMWKHSFSTCRAEPISADQYLTSFVDLFLNGVLNHPPKSAD